MKSMLAVALEYLDRGWCVIPMRTIAIGNQRKKPHIVWKQYQVSRPTRDDAAEWWTRWPDAGIGLILGPVSGTVAVDVDSLEAEQVFFDLLGGEPNTLKTLSGSRKPGKAHYLFRCPPFPTNARFTPLHPKLELRGHGGYVVAPPSLHQSGNRYEFAEPKSEITELPEPLAKVWQSHPRFHRHPPRQEAGRKCQDFGVSPKSLMSILRIPGLSKSTQRWLIGDFAYDDGWNNRLFFAACDLAGFGVNLDVAEPLLLRGAMPRTSADEDIARRTIQSAFSEERIPFRDYAVAEPDTSNSMSENVTANDEIRIIVPSRLRRTIRVEVR